MILETKKLKSKFLTLYHNFILSDEWEGNLDDDLTKIALDHTTTQIEALLERLINEFSLSGQKIMINHIVNEFLKEINN